MSHLTDLALARACLSGDAAALKRFDDMLLEVCNSVARRSKDLDVTELHGALSTRLLVEPRSLQDYSGQGSLAGWLTAVAVRTSLNTRRTHQRESARLEAVHTLEEAPVHPELELLRTRHRDDFNAAFSAALASLDAKDRALLRLNAVDGLGLDRIARLKNVGRSTAARWLATIRERVLEETRRGLQDRLGASDETVDSLLALLRSQLDVSLRTALNPRE
ncbi:MAG: sigma-70 family RNA polymerase sigma factor [Archangium sp.]